MDDREKEDFYASGNERDYEDEEKSPGIGDNSGEDPKDALRELDKMDLLKVGEKALLVDLVAAIEGGWATPQEKAIFAGLCKTNGLVFGDAGEDNVEASEKTKADLPQYSDPSYQ